MKKTIMAVAGISALALTLAACGSAPESGGAETATVTEEEVVEDGDTEEVEETEEVVTVEGFKACMVSDAGGYDDESFNQSGHEGLLRAKAELGVETNEVESRSDADYAPNIDSLIADGCTYVIGVGFLLEPAIQAAAKANPDIEFALIDSALSDPETFETVVLPNVKPLLFNTAEAAFLAGYAAAGMSESGVVGTFGGLPIPSVQIFMDGFADGVTQYNEDNGTSVRLDGWDKATQTGSFAGTFDNEAEGKTITEGLIDQGADIVMPVAGPVGNGAGAALSERGGTLIWVDSDGFLSTRYGAITLTSVMKEIGAAVFDAIKEASEGNFSNTPYVGTLENEGVGIAPWHDFEDTVPTELKEKIAEYTAQIIDGSFTVESPNAP